MCGSLDIFAPSSLRLSGALGLKVSIAFLLGSWFKVKFSQLIASTLEIGRAILRVLYVTNIWNRLSTLFSIVFLLGEVWMLVSQWTGWLAQMPQSGISLVASFSDWPV
jgi:hypothetical protein